MQQTHKIVLDRSNIMTYNGNRNTKGGADMAINNIEKINLTDDTLKNILIMAPLLSKEDQCKVYGMMFGILSRDNQDPEKKVG